VSFSPGEIATDPTSRRTIDPMYSTTESKLCGFDPALHPSEDIPSRRGLSRDEVREMAALIAVGDQAARNQMVRAYLGLVVTIAREFQGRGLVFDDLVGEGNLGLIRAAEDFDPDFGTLFSTYASYWVKQAIRDALVNRTATIRLPVHMVRLLTKWRRTERTLGRQWGRVPDFDEVASVLGLSERQKSSVRKARLAAQLRLEDTRCGEAANCLLDTATDQHGPVEALLQADERDSLMHRMESLDNRERTVLTLHYGLDGESLTLREVGTRLGLCGERVRKIEAAAIRKLSGDHDDGAALSRPARHSRRDCRAGESRNGGHDPAPARAPLASHLSSARRERHHDLENEAVVSQAARENEEMKELVRAERPWQDDGPVQQIEHGPDAVG
jgi:RNA polymerase primary sigma factor